MDFKRFTNVSSYKQDFLQNISSEKKVMTKKKIIRISEYEHQQFSCLNNCGRKYKYRQSMMLHFKFECGKEPQFKCDFCNKKFAHRGSLRNHVGLIHKVIF